ncbi:MAG: hypothetical protein WCD20_13330 [Rhodomicrobium sp.]
MKSFASPSFFRVFDLLLSSANPGMKLSRWTMDGVECDHVRHSFSGPMHGFVIEIFTLTHPGKRGWSLMVVKEFWYAGKDHDTGRMPHWAKLTGGDRANVLSWFRKQEASIEQRLAPESDRLRDGPSTN